MILCMAHIVKIQKDPMVVGQPEILQIFQYLINLTIDARPKVQREFEKTQKSRKLRFRIRSDMKHKHK